MMQRRMQMGDFMVAYLRKLRVDHIFGIPGDLVLKLFMRFGANRNLKILTLSHEPGVGYAADGYARATGKIGVICVTYGAGGHNMVNAAAGSFSERVPLLIFSGGPGEQEQKFGALIHHQAREIESQHRIYQEVTCASAVLEDPRSAAEELHRVVKSIWAEQRPGYIEIHRDMVDCEIEVPPALIEWDGRLHFPESDGRKAGEAALDTAAMFNAARHPVVIGGIEIHRYKLTRDLVALAEKLGAPVMTTMLGKGAFPMDHPLHMGVHIGGISPAPIVKRMDQADFVLNLGCLKTDMNFGSRPPHIIKEQTVWAVDRQVEVRFHTYGDVGVRDFLRALLKQKFRSHREKVTYADNLANGRTRALPAPAAPVRVVDLLTTINAFLADKRGYMVVAESGDMLFAGLDVRVPFTSFYMAQGYYASMGFSVPAALGAQIGSGLRPLILCGDGAFQMTGFEVSHAPAFGANPVVVVINNGGWQIFRPVTDRTDLLSIPPWPYAKLAEDWGGLGVRVERLSELRPALDLAHRNRRQFALIEVTVAPDDLSPVTLKYIKAAATHARTRTDPSARSRR
jgi:indolepyruvate decarboxylase